MARCYEGHNCDTIKSHTPQVGDPENGEQLCHRISPTRVKDLSPTSGFTAWGLQQQEEESPESLALKASRIWLQNWGKKKLYSWRTHTGSCAHQNPGRKSSDPIGDWVRPACLCWSISCRGGGMLWLTAGTNTLATEVLGSTHRHEPPWRSPLAPPNSL